MNCAPGRCGCTSLGPWAVSALPPPQLSHLAQGSQRSRRQAHVGSTQLGLSGPRSRPWWVSPGPPGRVLERLHSRRSSAWPGCQRARAPCGQVGGPVPPEPSPRQGTQCTASPVCSLTEVARGEEGEGWGRLGAPSEFTRMPEFLVLLGNQRSKEGVREEY